jgi:hypothetical protein
LEAKPCSPQSERDPQVTRDAHHECDRCGAVTIALTIDHQPTVSVEGSGRKRFAAVAFDSLVLFNPDSVMSAVDVFTVRFERCHSSA